MKVYLVFLRGWEDNHLEGIFASQEEAQALANKLCVIHERHGLDGVVEEHCVTGG